MLNEPYPNLPLLKKILEHIDAEPDQWDQGNWFHRSEGECGTAACIAGWACILSGDTPVWATSDDVTTCVITTDTEQAYVDIRARQLLGLTGDESERLFEASNNRGTIQYYADAIAERAGERL